MRRPVSESGPPRITADFDYGGLARDDGRVYLKRDTEAIAEAGIELHGASVCQCAGRSRALRFDRWAAKVEPVG